MTSYDSEGYPVGGRWQQRQLDVLQSVRRLPNTWVTAENEIIEIARMKNSHLRNTIEMLRRTALRRLAGRLARDGFEDVADAAEVPTIAEIESQLALVYNADDRAAMAWGSVYDELVSEALFRSDGDLEEWMQR